MVNAITSFATLALSLLPSLIDAAPTPNPWGETTYFPVVDQWLQDHHAGKYPKCTDDKIKIRKDFDSMQPAERKAYTDAIKCIASKPSQLDQTLYPAAINRYFDYAVTHVNQTRVVHLDGFFLTWHRYYLHLFEKDLEETCGYTGAFPYWNWPATADNLHGSAVFDGSDYSMSGDGVYVDSGPVVLSPTLSLPHGSGGGCVSSGPVAGWERTMADIPTSNIVQGLPLPDTAFNLNRSCLTRDLNTFAAQTWTNYTALYQALNAETLHDFDDLINGVVGGGTLGLHSGAHFIVGSPGSSIFVSVMDPIWWPLHAMLDNLYTSWQIRHPELADSVFGTETAQNLPPSNNVTLDSVLPSWGYFEKQSFSVGELVSTTAGPFCYKYDVAL